MAPTGLSFFPFLFFFRWGGGDAERQEAKVIEAAGKALENALPKSSF